ncbi:methionine--tRNA ligase [Chloropicon roscoffensis]|uniref:Methionine--tRNA ligase n=1 Tax=Chloropicon roscoffensis TaxID=1461544 RepID=A0AAX4NYX8_9CHLO
MVRDFHDLYAAFAAFSTASAPSSSGGKAGKAGKADAVKKGGGKAGSNQGEKKGSEKGSNAGGKGKGNEKKGGGKAGNKGEKKGGEKGSSAPVDISILDIRVGKILRAEAHPEADGLYVSQIDVGEAAPRQIISGLRKFVAIEDMQDRNVVVVLNLKPAKMRGIMSNGMVLCASNEEHTKVDPLRPPAGAPLGEKVQFEGFDGEPIEVINPKKKLLEKLFPDLKTDASGVAVYKNSAFTLGSGTCVGFPSALVR